MTDLFVVKYFRNSFKCLQEEKNLKTKWAIFILPKPPLSIINKINKPISINLFGLSNLNYHTNTKKKKYLNNTQVNNF